MKVDPQFQITKDDNVTVAFYSELMSNYFPESAIDAGESICSLMVAPEQPFIFCLDKEGRLQGILRSEGSASGWVKMMFSEGKVASFELEYNVDEDYFQLAKVEDNKVWISDEIPLDSTQFATLDKSISWSSIEASNASEIINKVSIGVEHVLFATETKNKDANYYVAELDDLDPKPYTLPENGMKITQFELGNFQYNAGVFLLYDIGKERSFIFQSFPDAKYDKTTKIRFESDEFINCFTLVESDDANDIVYAAGTQIHQYITAIESNDFEVNTLPGKLGNIKKIAAARNEDEHSVWSLNENGLHYQTNHFFDQKTQTFIDDKWTQPIVMVKDADQFSCVKGNGIRNQLFAISTKHGSELTRLWQDKVTTLWNTHTLTVQAIDGLKEVESYSAHIRFNSKAMKTFQGLNVRLSADSNLFVYVNSKSYHIGPDHEVDIPLNVLAEFTVICPVKDIATSKIYINADFLKETQAINLKGKVLERLEEKLTKANGLGEITDQNGKRLVAEGTDPKVLESAEEGIKQMLSLAKTMENDSNAPLQRTSFSIGNTNGEIQRRGIPKNYSLLNEGLTLGDFLHSVWDGAKQAVEFIVEKVKTGIQFVIKIGEQVFNWIVTTIREVGSFIQKIFDAIKVFFKDLFDLLAFLFDWDAIVETKKAFKDFTNEAILCLKDEIGNIKDFVDKTLDEQIGKFSPELVDIPDTLSKVDPSEPSEKSEADPRSNWLNSKKDYLHDSSQKPLKERIPTEFSSVFEKFMKDLKEILVKSGEGFKLQMDIIFDGFKKMIKGEMQFIDFLKLLLQKLAGLSLFLVKQLMDLIFISLEALINVALVGLNKAWEIPLITELYKSITKSDELTFLDVMCLFVAIPTTVLYKIGFGKAPFGEGTTKEEFVKRGSTIFQLNLN
ncbi:hypothetical protein H2O64_22645 [Kordia sp. YSTF-M3]|uniref:Uncharacterized protein n=1 Tax=Kordia aestuariivivens TaxID=2759037 RepID=A0ABR7QFY5_9FLAO|nr:hypothetical protein [Kordia aestuariivivens]MBC8757487.1 hypothetical protein [Kordia aestuariivivens]